jgi:hypothetical protein
MPLEVWEQNLADVIDDFLKRYKGISGSTPLQRVFTPSAGQYFVKKSQETGVDPSLVLGICKSESSMATNAHINGGPFNIYGDSSHFSHVAGSKTKLKHVLYSDYLAPTDTVFRTLSGYIAANLITTDAVYKRYEGEASWRRNVPMIKEVQKLLTGDPFDVRYQFDETRKKALAKLAEKFQKPLLSLTK